MIPSTLEECFQALTESLTPAEQIHLMSMSRDELIKTHHRLGQWIRNTWKLWAGGSLNDHMISLGFHHPDDMSSTIIKEYWLWLNKKPSELEQDVKEYEEYWDNVKKGI